MGRGAHGTGYTKGHMEGGRGAGGGRDTHKGDVYTLTHFEAYGSILLRSPFCILLYRDEEPHSFRGDHPCFDSYGGVSG